MGWTGAQPSKNTTGTGAKWAPVGRPSYRAKCGSEPLPRKVTAVIEQ